MARADGGFNYNYYNGSRGGKWCSYKRTTIIICSINIIVALYVLHNLYTSLYTYPYNELHKAVRHTPDQIKTMEESIRIRKESEPLELIKLVEKIKHKFNREEGMVELPQTMKRKMTFELLEVLRGLNASANATLQLESVELWRKQKLKEAKELARGKILNSTVLPEEAGMLARALESNWAKLSQEIGLYIPVAVINKENDDKPEGVPDFDDEILPGKRPPPECNVKLHTDYDGSAVRWGLTHHKESAYDCCQACLDHAKNAKPGEMKCNIWVYCPSETGCYSPDIYEHKLQECWLKHAEKPKVNFKDKYSESYRHSHPNAPLVVPWVSGVVGA